MCNVVQEAPDNIAQKKILFNVVLLLLKQHCTCKNLEQRCPRCYRQHCTGKILFYVAVILLRQHCTSKNPFQCCSRESRKHCTRKKPSAMSPEKHLVTFRRFLFSTRYFFDNKWLLQMPRQHHTNFPNIAQEKSRASIEQKGKIVWNSQYCALYLERLPIISKF